MAPLHLRFKRKDTTAFMLVDSSDSFRKLRLRLAEMTGLTAATLRLYLNTKDTFLEDESIVADHAISDDAVISFTVGEEPLSVVDFTSAQKGGAPVAGAGGH